MNALRPAKFVKLKIIAYDKRERIGAGQSFEAMFNPQSFNQTFQSHYAPSRGIKNTAHQTNFLGVGASDLSLTLLFDGTGVVEPAQPDPAAFSVARRVKEFLEIAYMIKDNIHEPRYLRVVWGVLDFRCRLADVTVTYTLFDRDGAPLRAEVAAKFAADQDKPLTDAIQRLNSPDVTHTRTVKSGDTLPLLSTQIYETPAHYLRIARVNRLDNLRRLDAGRVLHFPPLSSDAEVKQ